MNDVFGPLASALARHRPREVVLPQEGRHAAVALVVVPGREQLELLLIRRAERAGDPWSGHMGLPGGRREACDVDLAATARRETLEETGVVLPESALLGRLDDLFPTRRIRPPIVVRPYVFGLTERPAIEPNHEVHSVRWTPVGELEARRADTRIELHGTERVVPAFAIEPVIVWGMTHRILEPFLELAIQLGYSSR